jgi:senataxin
VEEEEYIMTDVVADLERLLAYSSDQHWLCPRNDQDGDGLYYEEDVYNELATESPVEKKTRLAKLAEAEKRKTLLLNALRIFAFDGADALKLQESLLERLNIQLGECDVCIRVYHKARSELKYNLEQEFDEEDVANFMATFDTMNIKRIQQGTSSVTYELNETMR